MAKLKCPKCKGYDIERIAGKTKTSLNLNPLKPFTLVNSKPTGKQEFHCKSCGKLFKVKF